MDLIKIGFEVTLTFNKRIRREAQIRTGIADVSDP